MQEIFHNLGTVVVGIGAFFIVSSTIGVLRFQDLYSKAQAASVSDSCGIPVSLIGVYMISYPNISTIKLIVLLLIMFIINPTSTHILMKTALNTNYRSDTDNKHTDYDRDI